MKFFSHDTLRPFAEALLRAAGCSQTEARVVADHLVESNLLGHDSHGMLRVPIYLDWMANGKVFPNREALTVIDAGPILLFDGQFGFGQVIAREAMKKAAARAEQTGVVLVAIRNCGHLGRIGAFAQQLAEAGLVSLHFANSSGGGIMVAPHGGAERRLSANPIAAGAPGPEGEPFVLDLSTASIAEGSIMLAIDRGEALAPGLIVDGAGQPTTDPNAFYGPPRGAILPFGAHKGSGLSFFCEILAGALTGGRSGHPDNPTAGRFVNNMLSVVIKPSALGGHSDFAEDVAQLAAWVKSARPMTAQGNVLLPGENGSRTRAERSSTGIPIPDTTLGKLHSAAKQYNVAVPPVMREA